VATGTHMAVILALPKLFDAIASALPDVRCEFGWKAAPSQLEGAERRIVCMPGGPTGDAGIIDTARFPGRDLRPLATLQERATWYLFAQDLSDDSDRAQYQATRELFDLWYREAYLIAHGTWALDSIRWVNERVTRRRGAELEIVMSLQALLPDTPVERAPTNAGGHISVILGSRTELVTIEGPS
jgi:hypothetical protein